MTSGTVGYTDTKGNKDYTSIIASQIGKRLKQASNMASDERAFAEKQAEAGGTSLEEAGIGKGYFFGKALGSRFGGDRIARTKGRMGMGGDGTNPAANYKQRFRGGFDYNITNQVSNLTDTVPLSNAVITGLRGVQTGLTQVASAISRQDSTMDGLANTQADMAKAIMFNGYLFQMFMSQQKAKSGRESANREEGRIEGRSGARNVTIGGASFGGAGGGRGMVNVTPPGGGGGRNTALQRLDTLQTFTKFGGNPKGMKQVGNVARSAFNVSKIADKTGALLNIPKNVIVSGVSSIDFKAPFMALKALRDSISAQSADGLLGFGSKRRQFFNFWNPNFAKTGTDTIYNPKYDKIRKLKGKGILDSLLGPPTDLSQGFADDGTRFLNNPFPNTALSPTKELVGEKVPVDLGKKIIGGGRTAFKKIIKKFGPKKVTNEAVDNLAGAARIADLSDAGVKTVDIAADQIVKKATKNGLTRGSALTRMMVKKFGAAGTKSILKQIPIVAGAAGVIFGIQRAMEGDFLGAGLEITSGLLGATGTTPGLGLMIDGFLLGRDLGMVPMKKGGKGSLFPSLLGSSILKKPTVAGFAGNNAYVGGDAGDEAFIPLEGAQGEIAGSVFGEANAISFINFLKKKKPIDDLRYDSEDGIDQKNPFTPGSTLYRNFERMRQYDMHGLDISKNMSGVTDNNADAFKLSSQRAVNQEMIVSAPITNHYHYNGGGGGDGTTRDEVNGAPFSGLDLQEYYAKMGASRRS